MKKSVLILLLAIFVYRCNTTSQDNPGPDDSLQYYPPTPGIIEKQEFRRYFRELSSFFDSTLLSKGFNGGILIAKDGAVIYEKYAGLVDLRKKDSLSAHTPLHIASTSKPFTGTAILRLVQENRLSLNDSLEKFFPGFPYPGITIRMLLTHRSGLPNYVYFMDQSDWDKKKKATNKDILHFLVTEQPRKSFNPDTRFNYSNTNYILLAMIIEKVTGKSFPEFMQEKFFGPLQMRDTYVFTIEDTLTGTPSFTATGVYWDYDFLDATYGDKNIYTTPRDLLKWDQALYTDQLIRPTLLDSAFTGYSHERVSVHNYGLGWRLQLLPNGKKVVYHFGRWHGSNAAFARLIDEKVTIIVLGNKFTRHIYYSALLSYDLFGDYNNRRLDDEDVDSTTNKKLNPAAMPGKKTTPALLPSKKG